MRLSVTSRPAAFYSSNLPQTLLLASLGWSFAQAALADSLWSGAGSDDHWSTALNWNTPLPTDFGAAVFGGNTPLFSTVDTSYGLSSLAFSTGAPAYTINIAPSASLQFINAGILNSSTSTPTLIASGSAATGGSVTFLFNASSGGATLMADGGTTPGQGGGTIYFYDTSSGDGSRVILNSAPGGDDGSRGQLNLANYTGAGLSLGSIEGSGYLFMGLANLTVGSLNTDTEFSGQIDAYGNGGSFTKVGTGTLVLSGNDFWAGATTISGGTLQIGNGGTSGSSGGSSIVNNAALVYNRSDFLAESNAISGTGTLTQNGTGILVLSGSNSYSGNTVISRGVLRLGSSQAFSATTNLQLNGGLLEIGTTTTALTIGTGAKQIQWTGDGGLAAYGGARTLSFNSGAALVWGTGGFVPTGHTLILGSASSNNTLTISNAIDLGSAQRSVKVNRGSGSIDAALTGLLSGTGGMNLTGDGILRLTGTNTYTGGTILGGPQVNLGSANALGTSGDLTFQGSTLQFSSSNTTDYSTRIVNSTSAIILDTNGRNVTFASALAASNTGGLTKLGSGTLTLSAPNAYSGPTDLVAGTISLAANNTLGTGTLRLNGGTLQTNSSIARTLANDVALLTDTTIAGTGNLTFTGGTLTNYGDFTLTNGQTATTPLTLNHINLTTDSEARTLTFAGDVIVNGIVADGGAGAGRIQVYGAALTLKGNNTYTGGSYFQAATVTVGHDHALGSGDITFNTGFLQGDGTTRALANNFIFQGGVFFQGSSDLTLNGNLSDYPAATSGSISFSGTNTVTLNGNNLGYTRAVILNSGVLVVSNNNALGTGQLNLAGGTIRGNGTTAVTLNNPIKFSTSSIIAGSSDLTFNGLLTAQANLTLTNNNSATTTFGDIYLNRPGDAANLSDRVTFSGTGKTVVKGTIANGSTLTNGIVAKSGTGTLVLTEANTYSGGTTVSAGTLLANNTTGSATGSGTVTVNASGTLGGSGFIDGNTTIAGRLAPGNSPGTLTFNANLTLQSAALTTMELASPVSFDHVVAQGLLIYAGTLQITFLDGYAPVDGTTFDLFDSGSTSGTFSSITFTSGYTGTLDYSTGILTVAAQAVPEPSAGLLALLSACSGLALFRRRRSGGPGRGPAREAR